jgi:tRNA threonylcarbamoyladenosine biosynthesis protein TsaB
VIVLAIDTALERCSAAVLDGEDVRATASDSMARGHQERLGPLVREVMAAGGAAFAALDRIGVTVGPGSFTGLRVGLAFAKGLGFALGRPVVGVGTLEALAASVEGETVAAVVDAKRGQLWVQTFRGGRALDEPEALEPDAALEWLRALGPATLVGSGAPLVAGELRDVVIGEALAPDPAVVARLAAQAAEPIAPPRPIYLRAPDARLPNTPPS